MTRKVRRDDTHGRACEIEVTVYGWKVLLLTDAVTKIPLAVKVGQIDEHETHWTRALVTEARANLAGAARLHKIVVDRGFLDGTDLWWLDQQGILFVVPAKTNMAVTVDARAQAAAGEGLSHGRRVHTVRHGQGKTAWTERLQREQAAMGGEPIGWQRWRRQLLEHTRHLVIVFTQGTYGIFHLAEYSLLSGVKLKDVPPEIGTLPEILAKSRLRACG